MEVIWMDDKTILQMLWQRAEQALDTIARKYGKRLYATALNILGCSQDAEESVNDTYLAVWNAIPPQNPASNGYSYFRNCRKYELCKM